MNRDSSDTVVRISERKRRRGQPDLSQLGKPPGESHRALSKSNCGRGGDTECADPQARYYHVRRRYRRWTKSKLADGYSAKLGINKEGKGRLANCQIHPEDSR